jgi:hypothetical protein
MGTKQPFKTYARGQRVQDTTITFAKGMSFTDAPLEEGFSKLLVNYDFGADGNTLKPRRGLRTTDEGLFTQPTTSVKLPLPFVEGNDSLGVDGMSIVAGNIVSYNGQQYYQIIIGQAITLATDNTKEFIGNAWVLTCVKNNRTDVSVLHYYQMNDPLSSGHCRFTKPAEVSSSVHGVPVINSGYFKQHVGAFAFNGEYYYFCTNGMLYHTVFNEATETFECEVVTPYQPYQSETQNSLYNLLLEEPYTFNNQLGGTVLRLTGFMPCERHGDVLLTKLHPQNGIAYTYKMFYTYPAEGKKYCFHIEYNTGTTDAWYPIERDETVAQTAGLDPFIFEDIRVDSPFAQFRVFAIEEEDAAGKFTDSNQLNLDALANSVVLTASFNYIGAGQAKSTTNAGLVRYNLSTATGMAYWKNRLWIFGARDRESGKQDNTILFASDVNRPDWFPYTANADIFDEEIVCLQPMLDDLLVFTTHNLYSLTLDSTGISWTRKHLQSNLNLSKWDLNFVQIVKNMVFFKSGNYFYMVVPKVTAASGTGLSIAPVSKNISRFLDSFEKGVNQVVDDLYNYSCYTRFGLRSKITIDLQLIHYYNYLDYEDVHNCYVFEATKKEKVGYDSGYTTEDTKVYLNFELLYNTVSRTWRVYITESQRVLQPLFANATGHGKYAELVNYDGSVSVQLRQYSDTKLEDTYIYQNATSVTAKKAKIFQNWQYLDTGNLNQNSDMKKRFREYQFKVYNASSQLLQFYSGFTLDKSVRTYEILYSQEEISISDDTVSMVIDARPQAGLQGPPVLRKDIEVTNLADYTYTTLGSWKLGTSIFPNSKQWKIRIPTSGKGYLPNIILISYNPQEYELVSCATVYRQLYSR